MARKKISDITQADVVIKSKRRCALCFGVDQNLSEKSGQIAHINGNNSDDRFENLVWLCLEHHDKFDSTTSQTKNYTPREVRTYRDNLYQHFTASKHSEEDIQLVRSYLGTYNNVFQYIFHEYSELAFKIDHNMLGELANIRDFWHTDNTRSFNSSIREKQDHIANNIVGICSLYEINKYDMVGNYIKYNGADFGHELLSKKKEEAKEYVDAIASYFKQLEEIATT